MTTPLATLANIKAALRRASGGSRFEVGYRNTRLPGQAGYDQREWAEENDLVDLNVIDRWLLPYLVSGGVFDVYCYGRVRGGAPGDTELITNCDLVIDSKGNIVDCYDSVSQSGDERGQRWIAELR